MRKHISVGIAFACALAQSAYAQDAAICGALLNFGIFDQQDTLQVSQNQRLLQDFFCTDQSRELAVAKQRARSMGISLGIFDVKFSGSGDDTSSERSYEHWRSRMCSLQLSQTQDQLLVKTEARMVARALMSAFERCIELRSSSPGLITYIETTPPNASERTFLFKARYIQASDESMEVRRLTISPRNGATCDTRGWSAGARVGARDKTLSCTAQTDQNVTVTLTTRRAGARRGAEESSSRQLLRVEAMEAPVIEDFHLEPPNIDAGGQANLVWRVRGAGRVVIGPNPDQKPGAEPLVTVQPEGRLAVGPGETTTYSLQAFGPTGVSGLKSSTLVVAVPPPRILTATFQPSEVFAGRQESTLSWTAGGSTAAVIVEGPGGRIGRFSGRSGSVNVGPIASDTTLTLTAESSSPQHNPDRQSFTLRTAVRASGFQSIGYGADDAAHAAPIRIYYSQHLPPEWRNQISSLEVFTDEWAVLRKLGNGGPLCYAIKGPKRVDNLHTLRPRAIYLPHGGDFAEQIDFTASDPHCLTTLR